MALGAIERLGRFAPLDAGDIAALENVASDRKIYPAHTDIVREGYSPNCAIVLLSGWACQYKSTHMGIRQITSVLMSGDIDLLDMLTPEVLDYSVCALSVVTVARVPKIEARKVAQEHPQVAEAMLRLQRAGEARLREEILNVSRRSAMERLVCQLLAIWCRASEAGLVEQNELAFPISQGDIADMLGLTAVHLNRTLQKLRATGLVILRNNVLRIPDPVALARFARCGLPGGRLRLVA